MTVAASECGITTESTRRQRSAGDLPVGQAFVFEPAINPDTAMAPGIAIPGSMRIRADRVVE